MGLPILLKDIIDAKGMYTSAGDWALRDSYPEKDSGVAKELRAHGVIMLGKLGLSEWANSFGSQPSGFSNLTGQVLNAIDAARGPERLLLRVRRRRVRLLRGADDRHRDHGLDHQPVDRAGRRRPAPDRSASSPATASRRSTPPRTPPARSSARSTTRR